MTAVCWSFSAVLFVVHGILIPIVGAKALGISFVRMVLPLLRPLIVALVFAPILLVVDPQDESPLRLLVAVGTYTVVYTVGCILFVMNGEERARFAKAALRRLPMATR